YLSGACHQSHARHRRREGALPPSAGGSVNVHAKIVRDSASQDSVRITTFLRDVSQMLVPRLRRFRDFSLTDAPVVGPAPSGSNVVALTGIHKMARVLITATEWAEFQARWLHAEGLPGELCTTMRNAMIDSDPLVIERNGWHVPFVIESDLVDVATHAAQLEE